MSIKLRRRSSVFLSILLGSLTLLVVAGVIYSPGEAFRASLTGLQIWWQNVFPGLLPPLMFAELLAASGLLHGLSTLAEPLTSRLFRLPGASGWAIAFGWSAGIPAGAKETARLRETGLIDEEDIDTVLLVSHLPNPFLIVLVIGCGFLQSPELGWAIALGLWLSSIISGILWSRLTKSKKTIPMQQQQRLIPSVRRAVKAAVEARKEDGRPFGKQLADSVTNAVGTLMTLGGLMMMSAVVIRLIQILLPGQDLWLSIPGIYELHLGAYETSHSALFTSAPAQAAALLAATLAWSGWSGLLQARAVFGKMTSFPWGRVITSRLLHSAIALIITYPLAVAFLSNQVKVFIPVIAWPSTTFSVTAWSSGGPLPSGWEHLSVTITIALISFSVFLLLALFALLVRPKSPHKPDDKHQQPLPPAPK